MNTTKSMKSIWEHLLTALSIEFTANKFTPSFCQSYTLFRNEPRSPEKLYGFEEAHREEDDEVEEFVWCKVKACGNGENLACWVLKFQMETLLSDIEKVTQKILGIIRQSFPSKTCYENGGAKHINNDSYALSGGQFKHVIGRPIYKGEKEDYISMAFLYSPPNIAAAAATITARVDPQKGNTISLIQQAMAAIVLTLVYYILVSIFNKF
ncbi:Detected protein of unknown function [Hibiscus syriacus]|uniref:Uncharacterized protein n=1 Tax=Hibiscus syriacus TaxID=106335 RepID=A0A6A3AMT1_HIBSY|nr:Detected protein of unknown function [Hibiscus syriacus]